jgi:hypothetical protein
MEFRVLTTFLMAAAAFAEGGRSEIPFRLGDGNNPILRARISDGPEAHFQVDLGAGVTVVSSKYAQQIAGTPDG